MEREITELEMAQAGQGRRPGSAYDRRAQSDTSAPSGCRWQLLCLAGPCWPPAPKMPGNQFGLASWMEVSTRSHLSKLPDQAKGESCRQRAGGGGGVQVLTCLAFLATTSKILSEKR